MNTTTMNTENKGAKGLMTGMMFAGIVAGVWAFSALIMGLSQAGWHVSELLRNYMVALGMIKENQTFVDYYTNIKGVEYIIAVAFLGLFPAFFKLVNRTKTPATIKMK